MWNRFKQTLRLLKWNWSTLLLFEAFYKILWITGLSILEKGFGRLLNEAGLHYLTLQNLSNLFSSLALLVGLILLVFFLAFLVFTEIAGLILYFDYGRRGEEIGVLKLFSYAVRKALFVLHPKNLLLHLFFLVFVPLIGVPFSSGPLQAIQLPGFILEFVVQDPVLNLLLISAMILVFIFVFRFIFSIHEVVLNKKKFLKACQESYQRTRKQLLRSAVQLGAWNVFIGLIGLLIGGLILGALLVSARGFYNDAGFWELFFGISKLGALLATIGITVCNMGLVSVMYYDSRGERIPLPIPAVSKKRRFWSKFIGLAAALLLLSGYIRYTSYVPEGWLDYEQQEKIDIVAHRGGASFAPENSLAALEIAIDSKADYAEIDVQQTKDGSLIVMHDSSFQRTAGVKKKVWEVTLDEMKDFTCNAFERDPRYENEKIPTLEQMILAAGDRIKLMIELKSEGLCKDLEEKTMDLIRKYDFTERCMIVSMDQRILENIKAIEPNMKTAYISAVAYGNLENMKGADMFSLEGTFVNGSLVNKLKGKERPLYVWTLNDEKSIRKYVDMGVSGIITDNPYLARYVLETRGRHVVLDYFVRNFTPLSQAYKSS